MEKTGKNFRPRRFGPRPIPSAQFSYDHNQCSHWFDRWLSRGGSIYRDSVYFKRAHDLPDRRNLEDRRIYDAIERNLNYARGLMRRISLAADIRHVRESKVIPLKKLS